MLAVFRVGSSCISAMTGGTGIKGWPWSSHTVGLVYAANGRVATPGCKCTADKLVARSVTSPVAAAGGLLLQGNCVHTVLLCSHTQACRAETCPVDQTLLPFNLMPGD